MIGLPLCRILREGPHLRSRQCETAKAAKARNFGGRCPGFRKLLRGGGSWPKFLAWTCGILDLVMKIGVWKIRPSFGQCTRACKASLFLASREEKLAMFPSLAHLGVGRPVGKNLSKLPTARLPFGSIGSVGAGSTPVNSAVSHAHNSPSLSRGRLLLDFFFLVVDRGGHVPGNLDGSVDLLFSGHSRETRQAMSKILSVLLGSSDELGHLSC
ncbi:uncharacterized protein B0H64DRAFT_208501 [Chaetomium fimeti]|uniref:Uncharacterized protein n=1 Tax=Chaetomium fimeti TaxID=1854472 RepID=A0AAE0HB68_9PEZI|nr:hypothetical protein B0H64DRAFT_208501 [Chaetomium fimeti]